MQQQNVDEVVVEMQDPGMDVVEVLRDEDVDKAKSLEGTTDDTLAVPTGLKGPPLGEGSYQKDDNDTCRFFSESQQPWPHEACYEAARIEYVYTTHSLV